MKRKLHLIAILAFAFTAISSAQTKVWDFTNQQSTWPLSSGIGIDPIIVDNLVLYPIPTNTNFGAITANNLTFADGFAATRRFQMNGGGYPAGDFQPMPTQRFIYFGVAGACTVKVWFRTGSNGAVRTLYVSNGSAAVGSITTNAGAVGDFDILTANYTGGAGVLYIYGDTALNLYKIEVTGTTVSTTSSTLSVDNLAQNNTNVYSNRKNVYVSNVLNPTEVKVYSITGALIKSFTTTSDVDFKLNQGFYVVNLKSEEGEKSVKVLLN